MPFFAAQRLALSRLPTQRSPRAGTQLGLLNRTFTLGRLQDLTSHPVAGRQLARAISSGNKTSLICVRSIHADGTP